MKLFQALLKKSFTSICFASLVACTNTVVGNNNTPCKLISDQSAPGSARPFIFNHAHQDNAPWWWLDGDPNNSQWQPQSVPVNSCIQIQLPATPTNWTVQSLIINGVKTSPSEISHSVFPNQNRYIIPCKKARVGVNNCPSQINQFELNILKPGTTVITIIGTPPALIPEQLAKIQGGFRLFTLTLKVTE